jgi:hypothetical protein
VSWQTERGRIAGLSRDRDPNDPELLDAKRKMRELRWTERVEKLVAEAPPLTDEQRVRIAALLINAGGAA